MKKPTQRFVKLLQPFGNKAEGETIGLDPLTASNVVNRGVAKFADSEAPAPEKEAEKETKLKTSKKKKNEKDT